MGRAFGKHHKQKAPKHAQVVEQQLSNSYDAGFFDGFHDGIDHTHAMWVEELEKVKDIGVKRKEAILLHMAKAMKQRRKAKGLEKNQLSEEVKDLGREN